MYLKNLKIRNFRNFYKADINFKSEDNIIIGDNGSGKTNLFNAIRLVLDSNFKLEKFLCDKDFNKKNGDKLFGQWIIISALFTDFKSNNDNISKYDFLVDENDESYINFFFKPKDKILELLVEEFKKTKDLEGEELENKAIEIKKIINSLSIENDYEIIRTFNRPFDFFDDTLYEKVIGNFEDGIFDNYYFKDKYYIGNAENVNNALKQINVTYIPPIRDVRENLASSNGMFSNLISTSYEQIDNEDKNEISKKVRELNQKISSIKEFSNLKDSMHDKMDIVGKNYFDSKFQIESIISDDKKELLKNLELKIYDYDDVVDIWRKSLGEANIIFFALKLLESERKKDSFRSTILDLLLIEEPEAHIHGHLQKALFRNLKENNTRQLLISTHSVNISEVSKISKMLILNCDYMETKVCNPDNGLTEKEIRNIERYLDANRSMLLFSKNVILVEGDAENIVIPWLIFKNFNITLDEMGISLVNISSTFFDSILPLFDKKRITKKCSVITDLDIDYTVKKDKQEAEQMGKSRKENIDNKAKNNIYVKGFYAENTFEIQLFEIDNNLEILKKMINSSENILYTYQKIKKEKIKSLEDPITQKETIMDIVEYKKKGWFALEFIDYCEKNQIVPIIPNYILEALYNLVIQKDNLLLIKWIINCLLIQDDLLEEKIDDIEKCNTITEVQTILRKIKSQDYRLKLLINGVLNVI